ncbi:MAG: 3-oxoacyl-[acyl-carrier protein] reductase [Maribacter sp.]|jgi:3-oxoacyl-[acyl-carrier protein] reductase
MLLIEDSEWSNIMKTNLDSLFYVTRMVLRKMIANRYGRIVNVVSLSGIKDLSGQINYSTSKAGLVGVNKALVQELGRRKITVSAVLLVLSKQI